MASPVEPQQFALAVPGRHMSRVSKHGLAGTSLSGRDGRRWAAAICGVAVTLGLQGCSSHCGVSSPITDVELDLEKLDRMAGCKDEWSFWWGNPCASDVPVLWAKKGAERHADWDFLNSNVENEYYNCHTWSTSGFFCHAWSANEISCDEEDWGECVCLVAAPNERYCQEWQCIAKEATQHECWEACCDDECTPCVECGLHGSSPFHINQRVYQELLALEGVVLGGGEQETVDQLRSAHFGTVTYNGECIASRDIHMPGEIPCAIWREIETELTYCWCTRAPDEEYCSEWVCEEKDVGMFSILFYRAMEYSSYVEGVEREIAYCLATTTNENGGTQCSKWNIEVKSFEEVEMAFCQACHTSWGCSEWMCDEYELPKIHDQDDWWKRLFFFFVHMLWMVPGVVIVDAVATMEHRKEVAAVFSFGSMVFLMCMCYSMCFLRWEASGRWRTPGGPWAGMWAVVAPAWAFAMCVLFAGKDVFPPSFLYLPPFMIAGCLWTVGAIPILVLFGIASCACLMFICSSVASCARLMFICYSVSSKVQDSSSAYQRQDNDDILADAEVIQVPVDPTPATDTKSESTSSSSEENNNMTNNNIDD